MLHACHSDFHADSVTVPVLPRYEDGLHYESVAKMILDTLRIGDLRAFLDLAFCLHTKLTPVEIWGPALACLLACKEQGGEEVVEFLFLGHLGAEMPPPPLLFDDELHLDAELWADVATLRELRAYFAAAHRKLPAKARRVLLAQFETEGA